VICNQHPDAAFLQKTDDFLDIEDGDRVDAGKRLVQQDKARPRRQRAAISTRRRSPPDSDTAGASERCEIERSSKQRVQPVRERVLVQVLQLEDSAHIFRDRQLAEDRRLLREVRQSAPRATMDRQTRQILTASSMLPPSAATRPTIM